MKSRLLPVLGLLIMLASSPIFAQKTGLINIGSSVGGTGIGGITVQLKPLKKLAFDFGLYGRVAHVDVFEPRWIFGPSVDANLSFFIRRKTKEQSGRVIADGLFLRGGMGLTELEEVIAGFGWAREFYSKKKPGQFFQLQVGPSLFQRTETFINTRYPPGEQEQIQSWYSGMIYARFTWFYLSLGHDTFRRNKHSKHRST